MRLKSFTASSMPAALEMVREAMGDNAIILTTEHTGRRSIKVTAAVEQGEDAPARTIKAAAPPPLKQESRGGGDLRFALQNILRFHNVPELFAAKMLQQTPARSTSERDGLEALLEDFFAFAPLASNLPHAANGHSIMLVGAPGIGKTFTIAKMATQLAMAKRPFTVVTTDNKRAGGVEQLRAFTTILGVNLEVAASPGELGALLKTLPDGTHALIDTAGCNAYEQKEMRELEGYATLGGAEPVLVMAAGGDSMEAIDAAESFAELPVRRLLVTRADTARRFGGILAAAAAYDLAFCNISASSSVVDALTSADAGVLAALMLQYQLQT